MTKYNLVNPYIKGTFETGFNAKTELAAANNVWESLGKHIKQNVPKFSFTLERSSDKKLFTFTVKETVNDGLVDYKLGKTRPTKDRKIQNAFKKKIAEIRKLEKQGQKGGKRKSKKKDEEEDDSSSSESDKKKSYYRSLSKMYGSYPISWFWYDPLYYDDSKFLPTITGYPYMYLSLTRFDDLMGFTNLWYK
jgi:hypothetical protein